MIKLYHAPLTRSVRIYRLLEGLNLPCELETIALAPPLQDYRCTNVSWRTTPPCAVLT